MVNKKISELPAAATITGTETVPLVQGGVTKGATVTQLLALIVASAPGNLDTFFEVATQLGLDEATVTTLQALVASKADATSVAATSATLWKPNTAYAAGQAIVSPAGIVVTALANFTSSSSYDATKWSDPISAALISQLKAGAPYIADRLTVAATYNLPTISTATASQISSGTFVAATADYTGDTHFRYNGCTTVFTDGTWVSPPSGAALGSQTVAPEFVTDAADMELKVLDGRTGTIGLRVIVDGRLTDAWQMQRITGTAGTTRYVRLTFPDSRIRHIRFEHDTFSSFGGVILGTYTVLARPARDYRSKHVTIGDSLQRGNPTYDFLAYESHSRLTSFLLGDDFYMNLGIGGTGWVADNSSSNPFSARLPVALSVAPHILSLYGSRNDTAPISQSAVRQAVMDLLALTVDVPNVIVGAVAQAGYDSLSDVIRQGVVASSRTYVDINALAQSNLTAPQGHPTLPEQIVLGKAVYSQLDRALIKARSEAADSARPRPVLTVSSSAASIVSGSSVTFTGTLSQAQAGVVNFYDGTALIGTGTASGTTATYTTSTLAIGSHTITARFVPTSPAVQSATSNTITQVVALNLGVTDTFNRADGPVGSTENNKPWSVTSAGAWVISGNALANPSAVSTGYCYVDPNVLFGTYTFTMAGTFSTGASLCIAWKDTNDQLLFNCNGTSNYWRLYTKVANVSTQLVAATTASQWVAGTVMTIIVAAVAGNAGAADITLKKDGATIIPTTRVDISPFNGATALAFGVGSSSNASKLDSVTMVAS